MITQRQRIAFDGAALGAVFILCFMVSLVMWELPQFWHVTRPVAWVGGVFMGLGLARFRVWLRTKVGNDGY